METRSKRLSQSQRPPYPSQTSSTSSSTSTSSSVFQSSSSLASLSSLQNQHQQQLPYMSTQSQQPAASSSSSSNPFASAPLPSPSTNPQQSTSYFPTSQPSQQGGGTSRLAPQASQNQSHLGQRGGGNGAAPETAPFLRDFNLVAEAAKRAQMACLARDLGDVGL